MKKTNKQVSSFNTPERGKPVLTTAFAQAVYRVVANIPKGAVLTYKEVAARAGSPNAARAVGTILSKNWNPDIPCHRVVRADGVAGAYNRGAALKEKLLIEEGAIWK